MFNILTIHDIKRKVISRFCDDSAFLLNRMHRIFIVSRIMNNALFFGDSTKQFESYFLSGSIACLASLCHSLVLLALLHLSALLSNILPHQPASISTKNVSNFNNR